jgi:hypothetical protein
MSTHNPMSLTFVRSRPPVLPTLSGRLCPANSYAPAHLPPTAPIHNASILAHYFLTPGFVFRWVFFFLTMTSITPPHLSLTHCFFFLSTVYRFLHASAIMPTLAMPKQGLDQIVRKVRHPRICLYFCHPNQLSSFVIFRDAPSVVSGALGFPPTVLSPCLKNPLIPLD